ncbi:MAG TPA: DUF475 domain-containing protein [Candidatus Saccharimonadales bacterium]|nr:DUF475 domain-containing protein [Candidatus Saccharimonadales bacterium]
MAKNDSLGRLYGMSAVIALGILLAAFIISGPGAVIPIAALAVIEVTFSFDNAVINSEVLARMNARWQTVFLTVGIAVAVFGVRFLLPLVMVSSTTGHSLGHVFDLALHNPGQYSLELHEAYPLIASFGGIFLLMLGMRFFGEKKEVHWLKPLESLIADFNQPWWYSIAGALAALAAIRFVLARGEPRLVVAGLLGALTFLAIKGLSELLVHLQPSHKRAVLATGWIALVYFLYLEILDASFSFDGVIAAFAITKEVFLIAAGLGIGALFVRSMTLHLLRRETLQSYRYLIHGAHYAITTLAIMLLITIRYDIPDLVTGFLGLTFIAAAFYSSVRHNRREHAPLI